MVKDSAGISRLKISTPPEISLLIRKFSAMSDENFSGLVERRPLKAEFYRSFDKDKGFSEAQIFESFRVISKTTKRKKKMISKFGGPWLMGNTYSLADIAVLPLIDRMQDLGFDGLWSDSYPSVSNWLLKAQQRPASIKSYVKDSRLSEQFPDLVRKAGSLSEWTDAYNKYLVNDITN